MTDPTSILASRQSSTFKRLLNKPLVCSLVLCLFSSFCTAEAGQYGDLLYSYSLMGYITITGYTGSGGDVVIPSSINDYPVTHIGNHAFRDCSDVTSVLLPGSIRHIREDAFSGCTGLTSIIIPSSVIDIGNNAFAGCAGVTTLHIHEGVNVIGRHAFSSCAQLANVRIPATAIDMSYDAFSDCPSLTNISVAVDNSAFCSVDGILYTKDQDYLIQWPASKVGTLSIPGTVTTIGEYSFYDSDGLLSINIPNSVTTIGNEAFADCDGVTSLVIPNSVTNLHWGPFSNCSNMTNLVIGTGISEIPEQAFANCRGLGHVTIPDNITRIHGFAFYYCFSLTNVTFRNGCERIDGSVFQYCTNLTKMTIPASVTSIGISAFADCTKLRCLYFAGNAPTDPLYPYPLGAPTTVYYLSGTTGWSDTYGSRPAFLWNPTFTDVTLSAWESSCTVTGTPDIPIALYATTNLNASNWTHLETTNLSGGSVVLGGLCATNSPSRFYRIMGP